MTAPGAAVLRSLGEGEVWEVVAAALGDGPAGVAVATSLDVRALNGPRGERGGMDRRQVRVRVEALAAGHLEALVETAGRWEPMAEGLKNPAWDAAWAAALRHLRARGLDLPLRASGPETALEHTLLTGEVPRRAVSLFDLSRAPQLTEADVRRAAWAPLVEESVTAADLRRLRPVVLRALRGRAHLLADDAVEVLRAMAVAPATGPYAAAMAFELSHERSSGPGEEFAESLVHRAAGGADALIPVAFCLSGWRLP